MLATNTWARQSDSNSSILLLQKVAWLNSARVQAFVASALVLHIIHTLSMYM